MSLAAVVDKKCMSTCYQAQLSACYQAQSARAIRRKKHELRKHDQALAFGVTDLTLEFYEFPLTTPAANPVHRPHDDTARSVITKGLSQHECFTR